MSAFSLDDIREAAEKKYASTKISVGNDVVVLRNVMRMPKDARTELMALQSDKTEGNEEEFLKKAITLVAETHEQAEKLLNAVGDDLAVLAQIFEHYSNSTELGEASASAS